MDSGEQNHGVLGRHEVGYGEVTVPWQKRR